MENNEDFENNGKRNEAKEQAKKVVTAIFKRISFKGIILIALIIGAMVLLSGAGWFVYDDMGTWYNDEEGRPALYTKNVNMKNPQTEGIVVDKDALRKQALLDAGYTEEEIAQMTKEEIDAEIIRRYKVSEKLDRTVTSLDDCTCAEILWCISPEYEKFMDKPENLEYLLNAELVTQYPYIDGLPEDKLNGIIKFYRYSNGQVGPTMSSNPENIQGEIITEEEGTETEEEPQESGIDASKVFYVGDSWTVRLKNYNLIPASYTYAEVGVSAANSNWASGIRSSIKSDSSAIVIMLGLNDTGSANKMTKIIEDLSTLNKPIYVLSVCHVSKGHTNATSTNKYIDDYNAAISSFCNGKSNVKYVDITSGLYDANGYLSDEVRDGTYHLNETGSKKLHNNIMQALQVTGQSGGSVNNSTAQGVITNTANAEECRLTYVTPEKFNELLNAYNTSGNEQVFKHFTMDEEANVSVAIWKKITTTFTKTQNGSMIQNTSSTSYMATTVQIDYKPMVKPYTLPFQYLWALLVMGEDYDFVEDLADLAYNAIIDIGIYDEVTTTQNIDQKDYNLTTDTVVTTYHEDGTKTTTPSVHTDAYTETTTITTETNMIKYDIAYADVWIVEVATIYKYHEIPLAQVFYNKTGPSEHWIQAPTTTTISTSPKKTKRTSIREWNIYYSTTQNVGYKKYERTEPLIREKTDIDENTSDNFVKALRRSVNAYNLLTNKGTIEWLCGVLENNEDTVNMVDLTRYLLAKAVDPDAAIEFDFSIFKPQGFSSFSSFSDGFFVGNSLEEKIWFALINAGYSPYAAAGALGNIWGESGVNPSAVNSSSGAYGLCQWLGGRKDKLQAFAQKRGKDMSDPDVQIEYMLLEISGNSPEDATFNFINSSTKYDGVRHTKSEWENAKDVATSTKAFICCFERPSEGEYKAGIKNRINKAQEYYNRFANMDAPTGSPGSASGLLAAIDKTARYLCQNNYTYKATDNVSYTFPIANSPNRRTLSCSSFVQECLLQAGYSQCSGGEKLWARTNSSLSLRDFSNLNINVQLITDMTKLQPGDIVQYRTGYHVVFVYSVQSNGVTVKGVPEVLNNNHGFNGVFRSTSFLQGKNAYALRIVGGN